VAIHPAVNALGSIGANDGAADGALEGDPVTGAQIRPCVAFPTRTPEHDVALMHVPLSASKYSSSSHALHIPDVTSPLSHRQVRQPLGQLHRSGRSSMVTENILEHITISESDDAWRRTIDAGWLLQSLSICPRTSDC
jgi:hypothetical protein